MEINHREIPLEVLVKILSFVPIRERKWNCRLVNKTFNDAVGFLDDQQSTLSIKYEHITANNEGDYQDIMKISRNIGKLYIHSIQIENFFNERLQKVLMPAELQRIMNIVAKFGPKLNLFYLWDRSMTALDIYEILTMIPRVETLNLHYYSYKYPQKKKRCVRDQEELNLRHLKKLEIDSNDEEIFEIFKRLPAKILIELKVGKDSEALVEIFKNQRKITKLTSFSRQPVFTLKSLDMLKLEKLQLGLSNIENFTLEMFENAMRNQPNLKTLRLYEFSVNSDLMEAISRLKNLEELQIGFDDTSVTAARKLPKVKQLTLNGYSKDVSFLEAFAQLDNSHLETLELWNSNITEPLLAAISASAPNLKTLIIEGFRKVSSINSFMRSFKQIEVMKIRDIYEANLRDLVRLCSGDLFSDKLKKFEIHHISAVSKNFAQKLLEFYPNLDAFIIKSEEGNNETIYGVEDLRKIANGGRH